MSKKKNYNTKRVIGIFFYFLACSTFTKAEIPVELLYQASNSNSTQHATIQGFQKTSTALKFVDARIYITYIKDKATLSQSSQWDKVYYLDEGSTDIRLISDTQNHFTSGRLSFIAKAGQKYQVKNNQADIKLHKEALLFWIENMSTGEVVAPKQPLIGITVPSQVNYTPVIISK